MTRREEIIVHLRELADGDGLRYRAVIFAAIRLISTASDAA